MWKPTVSVVMCTFNGAAFLKEQLDSILSQSYPITEFLIFDDGSTDETVSIVKLYREKHPLICFHQNEQNLGYNLNFEQALRAANSEVIAIADQDDYWHSEKIAKMVSAWRDETLVMYCDSTRFSGQVPSNASPNPKYRRFEGGDARKLFLYNTISGHAMLIKKALLPLVLPFKQGIFYDWWMGVVAASNGGVSYLPETLVYQRVHENNVTVLNKKANSKAKERDTYKKQLIQHLQHFRSIPNMLDSYQKFGDTFYQLWLESMKKGFHWPLFLFLVKNRSILFWSRNRKADFFSRIKYSFLLTKNKSFS